MGNEVKSDQAITKAMQLFWQKGYAGTSMRDLQAVLDMRPGSIYASLGDKDAIFLRALLRYREDNKQRLLSIFAQADNAKTGLLNGIHYLVFPEGDIPSQHCFMVKTLSELETHSSTLVEAAQSGLADMRSILAGQIAMILGYDKSVVRPHELAGMIQAQIIGLKTVIAIGRSAKEAEQDLRFMLATILPQLFDDQNNTTH